MPASFEVHSVSENALLECCVGVHLLATNQCRVMWSHIGMGLDVDSTYARLSPLKNNKSFHSFFFPTMFSCV